MDSGNVASFNCECGCNRYLDVLYGYDFRIRTSDPEGWVTSVYLTVDDVRQIRKLMKKWLKYKREEASGEN